MTEKLYAVITGTGSCIPGRTVTNEDFLGHRFRDADGREFDQPNEAIIASFEKITGISQRRYVSDELVTSDIAAAAARDALASAGSDGEDLDYIIFAHNFGDVQHGDSRSDFVPSLASRVKHELRIRNPRTVAYDLAFGCPGWVQGMIQADYYLRSGDARKALVIGADTLSRIADPADRDSMIYADGAGATVVEAVPSVEPVGILSHATRTDTLDEAYLLQMDCSNDPEHCTGAIYLKMLGRAVYEYALSNVPDVVKASLDKARLTIHEVGKILIHQANEKMDTAILKRLGRLYGLAEVPSSIMPMTISWLGNSSVATVPTLLDLLRRGLLEGHVSNQGDVHVFASVGAGMNINSLVYRVP